MFKDTSEITQNKIHALRLILLKKKKRLYSRKIDWLYTGISQSLFPEKNHT